MMEERNASGDDRPLYQILERKKIDGQKGLVGDDMGYSMPN